MDGRLVDMEESELPPADDLSKEGRADDIILGAIGEDNNEE